MRQARWVVPQVSLTKVALVSVVVLAKHSVAALGTGMISWPERSQLLHPQLLKILERLESLG